MRKIRLHNGWLLIAATAGALILVNLISQFRFTLGPFELELAVSIFNGGLTEIIIPPVGTISAPTHTSPLGLRLALQNVNINLLERFLQQFRGQEQIVDSVRNAVSSYLMFFLARTLLVAFIGGFTGVYLTGRRSFRSLLAGGIIGLVIVALLLTMAGVSYDPYAFSSPQFTGILEAAPWVFRLVGETLDKVDQLGDQLQIVTGNLYQLFRQIETLPAEALPEDEILLLHVSDIHNNAAALDFVEQVISTFAIDVVVDTGDITDYGTPLEVSLAERVGSFPVPYLFVPGNHDSPLVVEALRALPNVTVLEAGEVEIGGIKFAGIADPSSYSADMQVAEPAVFAQYIEHLQQLIDPDSPPDVVVAHHPVIAEAFMGIPLLLCGHTHQLSLQVGEESVLANAGTTGAAGIRGLQAESEVPYSLIIFYLRRGGDGQLLIRAADLVQVFQLSSGFSLERVNLLPVPEPEIPEIEELEQFPLFNN